MNTYTIHTLEGTTFSISREKSIYVVDLKKEISKMKGYPIYQQDLFIIKDNNEFIKLFHSDNLISIQKKELYLYLNCNIDEEKHVKQWYENLQNIDNNKSYFHLSFKSIQYETKDDLIYKLFIPNYLHGMKNKDFVDLFRPLCNIHSLNASSCHLEYFPILEYGDLYTLESLKMDYNGIRSLPDSIEYLENLTYLNLYWNQLSTLPESFSKLYKLSHLNLSNNRIETIPESFGQLPNLNILNLNYNRIKILPESFGNLKHLKKLYMINNRLKNLPESFCQFIQLEELDISHNRLEILPSSFGDLIQIKRIDISYNELKDLPKSFQELSLIHYLNLSFNTLNYNSKKIKALLDNNSQLKSIHNKDSNPFSYIWSN